MENDKLFPFLRARAYQPQFETALDRLGRASFPHNSERSKIVTTFLCSDGAVTFYLPAAPDDEVPDGFYVYDFQRHDLNSVCQTLHLHRLKIASPNVGRAGDAVELIPPDVPFVSGLPQSWFHEDVRRHAAAGNLTSLPGMTIGPLVHVTEGIRDSTLPGRTLLWSPTFDFPKLGVRRLYLWTRADFWWHRERLELDPAKAADVANADVLALQTIVRSFPAWTPDLAKSDVDTTAADFLSRYCDELMDLLSAHGESEEQLHQWLLDEKHWIFLHPDVRKVSSKVQFGDFVSDFVIKHSDNRYTVVEIEPATLRIFRGGNEEPTAEFNHACQQVRQQYIRMNIHHVREIQRLTDIYEPDGMVVIGRTGDIPPDQLARRWAALKAGPLEIFTYDELVERVRGFSERLRKIMQPSRMDDAK